MEAWKPNLLSTSLKNLIDRPTNRLPNQRQTVKKVHVKVTLPIRQVTEKATFIKIQTFAGD